MNRWKPRRVLEVGIGHGKWGVLAREYGEDRAPNDPRQMVVHGVEVYAPYLSPFLHHVYDEIVVGDIRTCALPEGVYDLSIMADVIEHLTKEDGHAVLQKLLTVSRRVLLTTPNHFIPQEPHYGNEHERHVSSWGLEDLTGYVVESSMLEGLLFGAVLTGVRT